MSSVNKLHTRSPLEHQEIRAEQILEALSFLLGRSSGKYMGKRALLKTLFEKGPHHEDGNSSTPRKEQVYATILPVLADVQTDARQILNMGPIDRRLRDIYDVTGDSGLEVERTVPLTPRQWLLHHLRSVFRKGPSNDIVLIMGMLLKLELSWLNQVQTMPDRLRGALMKHKGTTEYFTKIEDDIRAIDRCYGPPTFSFSTTMNRESEHYLANFVSQSREFAELKDVQVWDHSDEVELLSVRPGKTVNDDDVGYYVHQKSNIRYDNCCFHINCKRSPLQDWSRW